MVQVKNQLAVVGFEDGGSALKTVVKRRLQADGVPEHLTCEQACQVVQIDHR